eukprot:344712_1
MDLKSQLSTMDLKGGFSVINLFLGLELLSFPYASGAVDKYVRRAVDKINGTEETAKNEMMATINTPTADTDDDDEVVSYIQSEIQKQHETQMETQIQIKKTNSKSSFYQNSKRHLTKGVNVDIHDDLEQLELHIHQHSEKFDYRTEKSFAWLQVCTAALDIFAHGSNDVANAVAPFAAMLGLYASGEAEKEVAVPEWVLVIGALGMVIGLSTYGYKVMKCLGVRMAPMTCSRGYSIELSSSLVVILASVYGF